MKFAKVSKLVVLGLAVLLASSAFAAEKATLTLLSTASVNGAQLKPGEYKLTWDGSGPDVQLNILQGKKVVATVPAKVVSLDAAAPNNAAIVQKKDDGSSTLAGARFAGKKFALELQQSADGMQGGSSK